MKEIFGQIDGLDERALDFLTKALEKNNLPGFDFLEFKKAVAGLEKLGMDEKMAYKSAFTTAATMGFSKEKLVETVGYYRSVIVKEKEAFDAATAAQLESKVESKNREIARLNDQIERHKAQIARMQDEIAAYLTDREAAEKSLAAEQEKIEKGRSAFEKTHAAILLELDRDVEKIHANV